MRKFLIFIGLTRLPLFRMGGARLTSGFGQFLRQNAAFLLNVAGLRLAKASHFSLNLAQTPKSYFIQAQALKLPATGGGL